MNKSGDSFDPMDNLLRLRMDLTNLEKRTGKPQEKGLAFIDGVLKEMLDGEIEVDEERWGDIKTLVSEATCRVNDVEIDTKEAEQEIDWDEHEQPPEVHEIVPLGEPCNIQDLPETQNDDLQGDLLITLTEDETGESFQFNFTKFMVDYLLNCCNGRNFTADPDSDLSMMLNGMRGAIKERLDYWMDQYESDE